MSISAFIFPGNRKNKTRHFSYFFSVIIQNFQLAVLFLFCCTILLCLILFHTSFCYSYLTCLFSHAGLVNLLLSCVFQRVCFSFVSVSSSSHFRFLYMLRCIFPSYNYYYFFLGFLNLFVFIGLNRFQFLKLACLMTCKSISLPYKSL